MIMGNAFAAFAVITAGMPYFKNSAGAFPNNALKIKSHDNE
jgi:uncharacterized membrane protein